MSTELRTIQTFRGPLILFEIAPPSDLFGGTLQLTQGTGMGPDKPGFIQLSLEDAERLALALQDWYIETKVERSGFWRNPHERQ